jgi:hypothetical protein
MKNIGKPCAGKLHARFEEGGQEKWTMARLLRHRQTKEAATDRPGLRDAESCSLLYPYSDLTPYSDLVMRIEIGRSSSYADRPKHC